ncbi:GAF domain-containing protein [Bacillus taeanensis]|uniref:GAF domain-containing protein n=1 Tax=Bacillus taeanensis TaxID=273032 RepID=A0A366XT09_9BACI|nr:GAF domain-containing protein [Bacillus taeanensis]RBW68806.1 GAF domain-containing protein [Bacillus taeanensis]
METTKAKIESELNSLRIKTASDFTALAWLYKDNREIRWRYVSGNGNDRYKQMVGKIGKGLAGMTVLLGSPIILDSTTSDLSRKRLDYPIMIAENLLSAVSVPLKNNGEIVGVLLAGSRTMRTFTQNEIQFFIETAERMSLSIQKH